jgi:hypothetical protein
MGRGPAWATPKSVQNFREFAPNEQCQRDGQHDQPMK